MSDLKKETDVEVSKQIDSEASVNNVREELSWTEQFKELKKSRRAAYAAVACSSAAVLIGYDLTLIGSIIANAEFVKHFGFYDETLSAWTLPASRQLIWSIVQYCAAMAGAFTVGWLSDKFGRKPCFFATIGLTLIGTAIELTSPNWKVWIVAKLLMGTAMGFMQGNTPGYVSEISPVPIRGFMLSLFQFWIILGSFCGSCVLEGTSHIVGPWSWKAAITTQFGLGALCIALFLPLVPESPYFSMNHDRPESARKALLKLRGKEATYNVDENLEDIRQSLQHEQEVAKGQGSYLECFRGTNRRRTFIAILPMIMQHFSGYPLCGNYLAYFLTLSGVSDSFLITVIAVLFAMMAVIFSFILIEHVGRRAQYLGGVYGMLPCLLAIGILGCVNYPSRGNGIGLATFAIVWGIFYYLSLGAVGWTIVGEISSIRLRAKTTSIAAATNSLVNMGFSIGIPYLINAEEANLGPKAAFVFLGPSIILAIVAFFAVPETKNKSFDELDRLFEARTPARKF